MAVNTTSNSKENYYYEHAGGTGNYNPYFSPIYEVDDIDMPGPSDVTLPARKDGTKEDPVKAKKRAGKLSIFNRYSLFYYNSVVNLSPTPESYIDKPGRLSDLDPGSGIRVQSIIENPSAKNIINWSRQGGANGGTNAVEFAWEDFLWCKNYGMVPNNYMVTMRRFAIPVSDDLLDFAKQPSPDIGRMIAWVDGESNTWESVGLKFSTSLTWTKMESTIQDTQASEGTGNEGAAVGGPLGNIIKQASWITQPGSGAAARGNPNPGINPYQNKNVVFGPLDVIKEMMVRDKGLQFEQAFTLKFEYELRSIDGINPKVAMIDLLSNVLVVTANRGEWWGGEIRYYGGNPRKIKPLGDPAMLEAGDMGGYFKSIVSTISSRLETLTGGAGLSMEGLANAAKGIGGALMDNVMGGALDKMGRPQAQALNALLSGEDTGEWHVMVGNPANPIISVGNLILEKTELAFSGPLGPDDFPTKLTVMCTLKPARPRDRTDIMSMFHRNGRTYLTQPPTATRYAGNLKKAGQNGGKTPPGDKTANMNKDTVNFIDKSGTDRFPNHETNKDGILTATAQGIF
jgi:hypothetical protein